MTRLALGLETLRSQVNAVYPDRRKDSDGTLPSDAHHLQNPSSDHEPDSRGIVHALDLTHDPHNGFDSYNFADQLLKSKDKRIKYVISHSRIGGDEGYAKRNKRKEWTWYRYYGSNPHDSHVHVSINRATEDDVSPWKWRVLKPNVIDVAKSDDFEIAGNGKGSWYSQFQGQYSWIDHNDKPNSNALGVPDNEQGFAMLDRSGLGKWRYVTAPNGITLLLRQTDIGPTAATGRMIDIAAVAAEKFGYSPGNFPTDEIFSWSDILDKPPTPQETKSMKGWRTLAVNLFVAIAGVLVAFDWTGSLPSQYAGIALVGVAVLNSILRYITTTPVGQSE